MTPELYSPEWHRGRSKYVPFAERALLALFALEGIPQSMLDVGCGTGYLVALARRLEVNAIGVDVAAPDAPHLGLRRHDLREPLDLGREFDLVVTMEVAEHLPPDVADTFVESVARHVGKLLVWTAAQPDQGGDGHINCVIEGTRIRSPSRPLMATRRWYAGEVITLITTGGHRLAVTPNHPVLTSLGWLPARRLHELHHGVGSMLVDRVALAVVPDDKDVPPLIEDVFEACSVAGSFARRCMPQAPEDFHGDGTDGEVDVVLSNRDLVTRVDSLLSEKAREQALESRHPGPGLLLRSGAPHQRSARPRLAFSGKRERSGCTEPLFLGHAAEAKTIPDARISDPHAGSAQSARRGVLGDAERSGDLKSRLARGVERRDGSRIGLPAQSSRRALITDLDASRGQSAARSAVIDPRLLGQYAERLASHVSVEHVAKVEKSEFSGHVYNLHTTENWYAAGGIVTHNCQPPHYWREMLKERGLTYDDKATIRLREMWRHVVGPARWYARNAIVLRRP
jgi:SAM-dependent methyltransferase